MFLNLLEKELLSIYRKIYNHNGHPPGMFRVKPAIPFVGNLYGVKTPRIISYASAENLGYAFNNGHPKPREVIHIHGYNQYTRARDFYFDHIKTNFFPYIHCEPFNNGTQLFLTRHILNILGHNAIFANHPYGFIEQIAAGNPAKFSIEVDYASCSTKMRYSLEYIQADFNILKPEIIILPNTIFNTINKCRKWDTILNRAKIRGATFIKIYQLASRNNHRIGNKTKNLPKPRNLSCEYFEWLEKMKKTVDINSHVKWINNCMEIQHI